MMLITLLAVSPIESQSQGLGKNYVKEAKKKAKELKKAGWRLEGPGDLETAIKSIYEKESNGDLIITGEAYGKRTFNIAKSNASHDALDKLAKISGNKTTNISKEEGVVITEYNYSGTPSDISSPVLILTKETNGKYDCMVFFVSPTDKVDKSSAD